VRRAFLLKTLNGEPGGLPFSLPSTHAGQWCSLVDAIGEPLSETRRSLIPGAIGVAINSTATTLRSPCEMGMLRCQKMQIRNLSLRKQ
jgi:hypothetical protein